MHILTEEFLAVLQAILLVVVAPLVIGVIRTLKARLLRRRGPDPLQPYRNLIKLWNRPAVRSEVSSPVFAVLPVALLAAYVSLACMVPVFSRWTVIDGDLITVIYVLGFARFSLSLAGLDGGAPFGGLGASRLMFFQFVTEVGLVLLIAALVVKGDSLNLRESIDLHWRTKFLDQPALMVLAIAMLLLILLEGERLPIDNPATHLELTMTSKAITLEYAGRDLAMIELAEMVKLVVLLSLFINLFLPFPPLANPAQQTTHLSDAAEALGVFILKLIAVVLALVWWEYYRPKQRLRAAINPSLISMALSLLAIVYTIAVGK